MSKVFYKSANFYILTAYYLFLFLYCQKSLEPIGEQQKQYPSPPGDSTQIVFVSNRETNQNIFQVFIMDMEGNNVKRLTFDSNNYFFPQFSPDGSYIIFYSQNGIDDEIYRIDTNSENFINLTNSPGNDHLPQFSPDGSKIVFTSTRDGNREIYLMESDGSNQIRLTNNNFTDHSPQFSPDGSKIVFYSSIDIPYSDDSYDIYQINIDGSNLTRLTQEEQYHHNSGITPDDSPNVFDAAPRYSTDGLKIVFMTHIPNNYIIHIMNEDGSNPLCIANQAGGNFAPFFFPNGLKILFRSHRDGDFDLYKMDLDGEFQMRVTNDTGHTYFADFSVDGSKVLYFSNIDEYSHEYYHIYIANSDGTNRIKITQGNFIDYFPNFHPSI
jgi:Tol biopolymer transport system component